MRTYQTSQSGQGSRRGSRNRSEGRPGRGSSPDRRPESAEKPQPSLWQKITAFLGGAKPAAPARRENAAPASRAAAEPSITRSKSPGGGRVARKPENVEVTSPRLYVGNLSFDAAENDLTELFNGVGQVVTVEVVSHRQTQRSKGFGFVQMQTIEEAKRAVVELHDKEFMGRKLVVSGAKNVDQQDGRSEPRFAA